MGGGGGGGGGGSATRGALEKKSLMEWATHIHRIHQPIINSRLKTFRKLSYFSLTTAIRRTMKSNYGRSKPGPSNRHDSPICFLFLSNSEVNLGILTTIPFYCSLRHNLKSLKVKNISSISLRKLIIIIGHFLVNTTSNVDVSTGFHCLM